jgi:YrbI family 3-deoxy-D-manno-octulosonate 8-phosphate phosphatase
MDILKQNLKAYLSKVGKSLESFLSEHRIKHLNELSLGALQLYCHENGLDFANMICRPMFVDKSRLAKIKLLVLDIDGVMTDAGMFFTENGDQIKKYNSKDGLALRALDKFGVEAAIISSGFKPNMVKSRAELLKIKHVYVGNDHKIDVLNKWCDQLKIALEQVAIIGDDINDLSIMHAVGFSACPADAVNVVKDTADLVLTKNGGNGCVREFIDYYLLNTPLSS